MDCTGSVVLMRMRVHGAVCLRPRHPHLRVSMPACTCVGVLHACVSPGIAIWGDYARDGVPGMRNLTIYISASPDHRSGYRCVAKWTPSSSRKAQYAMCDKTLPDTRYITIEKPVYSLADWWPSLLTSEVQPLRYGGCVWMLLGLPLSLRVRTRCGWAVDVAWRTMLAVHKHESEPPDSLSFCAAACVSRAPPPPSAPKRTCGAVRCGYARLRMYALAACLQTTAPMPAAWPPCSAKQRCR